jgi:DNA-directed RNA polymerase subunit RPC12/RpoP
MKVNYKNKNGRLSCEFEGKGHLDVWRQIASFQEVFEEEKCGKCGKDNLRFNLRISSDAKGKEEYEYPELRCLSCGAKLTFGIMKDGKETLFPVRNEREGKEYKKDANGKLIPKGSYGWVKYNKETGKEE